MRYSTDTRTIRPGEIYVAIKGDRFDGHAFAADAVARGASGLVVEKPVSAPSHVKVLQVPDSIK